MDSREKKSLVDKRNKQILKNKLKTVLNHKNFKQLSEISSKKSKFIAHDDNYLEDSDFNYDDVSLNDTIADFNESEPQLLTNGDVYHEKTMITPFENDKTEIKRDETLKKTGVKISKKSKPPKKVSTNALIEILHCENENLVTAAKKLNISNRKNRIKQRIQYNKSVLEVFQQTNKKIRATISTKDEAKSVFINEKEKKPKKHRGYFLFDAGNQLVIVMKPHTKLYFCGKVKASLIKGNVNILGYKLTNRSVPVYSLNNSSLLCFESESSNFKACDNLALKFENLDISAKEIQRLVNICKENYSIILLEALTSSLCNFVQDHFHRFKVSTWKNKNNDHLTNVLLNKKVECSFYKHLTSGIFKHNHNWDVAMQNILKNLGDKNITFLCGGKGSGKSTFLRYAVNKIVSEYNCNQVLVIDLDPGQPEFTIPGALSVTLVNHPIIGPNFTHLKKPNYSVYFGLVNVMENEELYLNCVETLYRYCKDCSSFQNIPWIVNYMGYVDQSGASLLSSVLEITNPTNVVEIRSKLAKNNYEESLLPSMNYNHIILESFKTEWNLDNNYVVKHAEAKEKRLFNILAYFSQLSTEEHNTLLNISPYSISLDLLEIGLNGLITEKSRILETLNGQIVALCQKTNNGDEEKNTGNVFTITEDTILPCYGYGIVRGVDPLTKKLYLLSPVSKENLARVNTIVYSEIWPHMNIFSIMNLPINTFVPYTMPTGNRQQDKLMKAPKRKFNLFRLLELKRNK